MPVYRIMAALHPRIKLTDLSSAVKTASLHALTKGGAFLELEDRGIRRAWHTIRSGGQIAPQDQARFINMTCFVEPKTLVDIESALRKIPNCLRVRSSLVAETPYDAILCEREEEERARLQVKFQQLDQMIAGDERDKFKKYLMELVSKRKKNRFAGHRFNYDDDQDDL
tara:strand:+ start:80 stop:586 length:507 start_codon:yes stop_codon:yes gene_type:complete